MWQAVFIVGSLLMAQEPTAPGPTAPGPTAPEPTAPEPTAPSAALIEKAARLVRQLDDDRPEIRQAAEATLIQLGPNILELLPLTDAATSAEVRERLTRIRGQLQSEHSRRSVAASRVTLEGEMSLAEALQAIEQQTGNVLLQDEDYEQRVTLDLQQVPFWEALDRVLDEGGLTIDPFAGDQRSLRIRPAQSGMVRQAPHVHYQGVFRIEPTMVSAVRDLRTADLAVMRIRVSIAWEPRITPILLSQPLDQLEARDDSGRAVKVSGGQGTVAASVESDVPFVEMEFPFTLPPRSAQRLASLRGTLDVLIPARAERFEFADLQRATNVTQRRAGVHVTLQQTRQNDEAREVHIRIEFDAAANALESHRGWIYKNVAYLLDAEGGRVDFGGQRVISQDSNAVGMAYLFALERPLSDYRFVYETPSLIMRQPIAYELKNIDLP
ncbi:MAG: hypothetical protein ACYC0X_17980 [Pirellulaceae bacterium]